MSRSRPGRFSSRSPPRPSMSRCGITICCRRKSSERTTTHAPAIGGLGPHEGDLLQAVDLDGIAVGERAQRVGERVEDAVDEVLLGADRRLRRALRASDRCAHGARRTVTTSRRRDTWMWTSTRSARALRRTRCGRSRRTRRSWALAEGLRVLDGDGRGSSKISRQRVEVGVAGPVRSSQKNSPRCVQAVDSSRSSGPGRCVRRAQGASTRRGLRPPPAAGSAGPVPRPATTAARRRWRSRPAPRTAAPHRAQADLQRVDERLGDGIGHAAGEAPERTTPSDSASRARPRGGSGS